MTKKRPFTLTTAKCPVTRDFHDLTHPAWGKSCRACHKTWTWNDNVLIATWSE